MVPSCDPCAKRDLNESISFIVVVNRGIRDWTLLCGMRGWIGGCILDIVVCILGTDRNIGEGIEVDSSGISEHQSLDGSTIQLHTCCTSNNHATTTQ
jgi:hypothetical protein